jgi:hypothetical protein
MGVISITVNGAGLLDYAKAGKEAVQNIKKAMRVVLNVGRTEARHRIADQFTIRTGLLHRQAGQIQTSVTVTAAVVLGKVKPLPRLLNIFEHGATLAHGRGFLHPRPVIAPAAQAMEDVAEGIFDDVLHKVGT